MAYKPIDNKRDQFRKYLEASGVIDILSKSIAKLMEIPEKPESPVDFIRESMGCSLKERNQIEFLKEEVEEYKKQVNDLKLEIAGLKLVRQEDDNAQSKEIVVVDVSTVKDDIVTEIPNDKQTDEETKKVDDVGPSAQVVAKGTDDVQNVDNDVKADIPVVPEIIDVKVEPKTDDIKSDDKPAATAGDESTDK